MFEICPYCCHLENTCWHTCLQVAVFGGDSRIRSAHPSDRLSILPSIRPSGPISHKPFNILFWNIIHLFVTSVPCVQPIFGKLEFKIPDYEHFLRSYEIFGKVICVREALPKFSIVSKSVCCLCSCSLVKLLFCGGY